MSYLSRMNQSVLEGQMSRSWSPPPQDVSNEDEESTHTEASEDRNFVITAAAAPPPRATAADGLHLHLNSRAKSGYTRVESLPDGRFRVAGLDAEHSEVPLGIYSTALEAATVYARHARMRVPQVAVAVAVLRCPWPLRKPAQPNDTTFSQVKKRDEQRLAGFTYRQEGLIQDEPRAKKVRFQKRSSEAGPEAAAEAAAEGWVVSTADLKGGAVTTDEDEQLSVVDSIKVMGPAAAPAGRGHHSEPYGAMAQLGDQLEAQDPHGNWLGASVAGERGHGDERELLVHYNGWNKRHDEWLVVGGGRLQAAGDELSPERALVRSPAREAGVQRKAACGAAASLALALLPPLGREAEGNGHRAKKQPANGFTPEEDAAIRKGVLKHGTGKWKEILEARELAVLKHKSRTSDAIRLRYTRNILPDETQEAEAPQKSREAGVQGKPAPGLQLWRSGKNATGYVGVTCKDEKSTKRYCAKAPIVNGEGLYLGRFATALEAATAFAQHVQGLDEGWQQSRQLQNAWVEQHPGEGEEGKGGAKGEGGKGAKKGKGSKTAKRAEKEEVQGGGSDSSDEDEHGGSPAVRLVQSKSGADEYEAAPTVTRAAGLELHLSAKSNTGYQGVSWKKNQNDGNGQKRFYVTLKGSHLGCFPSAVEAAAAYAAHLQSERKPPAPAEQAQAKIRATPAVAPAPRAAATTKAAARRPISSAPAAANTTRKQAETVSYPAAAPLGAAGRLSCGGTGKEIEGGGGFARMAGVAAAPEAQANLRGWLARSKLDMYGDGLEELGYDDLDYLLQLPKETLAEVAEEVSMKPGHKRKFVDYAMQHSSDSCHDLPPKMTLATCAGSVVHEAGSFAIGDFVTAAYFVEKDKQLPAGTHESHRGRHYSGRIVGIDRAHDSFTVAYDDGDTEQDVQRASLRVVE